MVFSLRLVQRDIGDDLGVTEKMSTLHLVDLAGSERAGGGSGAPRGWQPEGASIGRSLSGLLKVIDAIVSKEKYVPFRESKLTRILQPALGGNSLAAMIATVCPAEMDIQESLRTLRFARRVRQIQNRPHINLSPAYAKLPELMAKDEKLRTRTESLVRLSSRSTKKS